MNIDLSRRAFLGGAGAGVAATTLGAFGFEGVEAAHAALADLTRLLKTQLLSVLDLELPERAEGDND